LKRLLIVLVLALACDVTPLSRDQLFGPRDASPAPDVSAPDVTIPDADPACVPRSRDGLFSGAVVDMCTGDVLDANVGIAGQHACTFKLKGSFYFMNLPVGCNLTVSATREGYRPHHATVVIEPGGLSSFFIRLERLSDPLCQGPVPTAAACTCDLPGCVTSAPP
jgi:hypothetical protein